MKQESLPTKEEKRVDVTKEMKERCYSKTKGYEDTIGKVEKEGNIFYITFSKDYTAFGQKERLARRVTEVMWYSRVAKEEKDQNKKIADYIKEFKEKKIAFDGKTIPEFIDTLEDVRKRSEAEKQELLNSYNKEKILKVVKGEKV